MDLTGDEEDELWDDMDEDGEGEEVALSWLESDFTDHATSSIW